eukprot:COSAG03_NODE_1763_length_3559_cov_40.781603_3_plen_134_part_00
MRSRDCGYESQLSHCFKKYHTEPRISSNAPLNRYALNTLALPACLLGLVVATWWSQADTDSAANPDPDWRDELKANKRADYYFAFFLCCASHMASFRERERERQRERERDRDRETERERPYVHHCHDTRRCTL